MKLKRKVIILSLFILLSFNCFFSSVKAAEVNSYPTSSTLEPSTYSPACLLMDVNSGKVLFEKNADEKRYPASTTKIMTAILAIENCDLSEKATVSYNAIYSIPSGYSTANLQIGEEFTIEELLYALLLPSANDAAVVIAEHISGSIEEFSKLMNAKAEEIGCTGTHFVNPNGIQNENHYSTARDLAIMGNYAMQNSTFQDMVKTTSYTLPATQIYNKTDRKFVNTNDLIRSSLKDTPGNYYYPYATGLKTGFTSAAMNCIVASAKKDGIELIVVVLGAGQTQDGQSERYLDCINLFNFGFNCYSSQILKKENEIVKQIKIPAATKETEDIAVLVRDEIKVLVLEGTDLENITPTITLQDDLRAPIKQGTIIGKIDYFIDGIHYSSNLIISKDVESSPFLILLFRIVLIGFILYLIVLLLRSMNRMK